MILKNVSISPEISRGRSPKGAAFYTLFFKLNIKYTKTKEVEKNFSFRIKNVNYSHELGVNKIDLLPA